MRLSTPANFTDTAETTLPKTKLTSSIPNDPVRCRKTFEAHPITSNPRCDDWSDTGTSEHRLFDHCEHGIEPCRRPVCTHEPRFNFVSILLSEIETKIKDYRDVAGRKGRLSKAERRGVCSAYQRRTGEVLTSARELMMRMALDHSCFLQASATARKDSLPSLQDAIAGENSDNTTLSLSQQRSH